MHGHDGRFAPSFAPRNSERENSDVRLLATGCESAFRSVSIQCRQLAKSLSSKRLKLSQLVGGETHGADHCLVKLRMNARPGTWHMFGFCGRDCCPYQSPLDSA